MKDYRDIVEIREVASVKEANELLDSKDWDLLDVAPGAGPDNNPVFLYCLGRPYREQRVDMEWV